MSWFRASRSYIEAFVSALSNRTDIKFIEGNRFGVDLKNKTFMYDPLLLQQASVDEVKGILIHEVGHLNYTSIVAKKDYSEVFKKYPVLSHLYNIFEDLRIERLMMKEFRNFAIYPIGESRLYAAEENYYSISNNILSKMAPYHIFGAGVMSGFQLYDPTPDELIEKGHFSKTFSTIPYFNSVRYYQNQNYAALHNKIGTYLDKIPPISDLLLRLYTCPNTLSVMKLVDRDIVPHILDLLEQEQKRADEAKEMAEALHGMLQDFKKALEGAKEGSKKLKDSGSLLADLILGSKEGRKILDHVEIPADTDLHKMFSLQSYHLTRHLQSILQEKRAIKYTGSFKRGKLIPRNVYKAKTHEHRMYSRRNHPDTAFYEVSFLIDESGSMQGEGGARYANVYIAAYIINRACEALRFKIHYINWDNDVRPKTSMSDMREPHWGGNNEDRVLKYTDKLIDHGNDNIIFLLTDGGVESSNSPKPMLAKFKKEGIHVIPIGVGIPDGQVKEFKKWYPDSVIANDMDGMVKAMANFLKTIIHR